MQQQTLTYPYQLHVYVHVTTQTLPKLLVYMYYKFIMPCTCKQWMPREGNRAQCTMCIHNEEITRPVALIMKP